MPQELIHSCPELIEYIRQVGMLPLLSMGIAGWSAEEVTDEDCQYTQLPDGGWEWPLWEWKAPSCKKAVAPTASFQGKSRVHQPRMVARFLQLPAESLPLSGRREHRRNDSRRTEN